MANPLQSYIEQRKATSTASSLASRTTASSTNPLADYISKRTGKKDAIATSTPNATTSQVLKGQGVIPQTVDDARKMQKENPNLWQRISKELMKPVGVIAAASEGLGYLTAGDARAKNTPGKIGGIITGTQQYSFGDLWKEHYIDVMPDTATNKAIGTAMGLITDIAADPLNFIGGGLTKGGKLLDKASKLTKAGDKVADGSKLAREFAKAGITLGDDAARLATTKAGQAQLGQRALLQLFPGTRFETTLLKGAPIYEATGKLATGLTNSKVGQVMRKVFSTKTTNEAFNEVSTHFKQLAEFRKGEAMNNALDIQKKVGDLTQEQAFKLLDVIETGKKSGVGALDDLADSISGSLRAMNETEKKLGLRATDIQNYFPHVKVKSDIPLKDRMARMFSDPRKWTTALGAKNERDIVKFVGDQGTELIGTADFLKLRELPDGTFVAKAAKKAGEAVGKAKEVFKVDQSTINEINRTFGTEFFESRPAVAYAQRALASARAVTSKEFFDSTKQFALPSSDDIVKKADYFRKLIDQSQSLDIERTIKAGDMAREQIFSKGNILTKEFSKGRIDDIALKLDQLEGGLGNAFRSKVKAGSHSLDDLVRIGHTVLDDAIDNMRKLSDGGVEVTAKGLEGAKFAPDVARQIDQYQRALKPEEINVAFKTFDSIQNWWKAQALVAPSYHIRNMVGNTWNNFLAGVNDVSSYYDAGKLQMGKSVKFTDDAGRVWDTPSLVKAMDQTGVTGQGWFAKDIEQALGSEMGGLSFNPLSQNFALFRANRATGEVFENNARIAHFIHKIKSGESIAEAAASVKKYLFDYADLTDVEKNLFKRVLPFYTWTRKNIPLQLENMIKQPAKFAAIPKVTKAIEQNVEKPNEKYLSNYIKDNIGIRTGTDSKGNTYYFLLGNWLPAAQAIDFLSQPAENFVMSVSPFFKVPIELWANKSTFFEDTLGDPQAIERYPEENTSWLGLTMRKKTAYILKNIRILNELDKLNPGAIFGDKDNPSIINQILPEAGVTLPGVGTITTSEQRGGRLTPETDTAGRILQSLFGKATPYNPNFSKKFYMWDTETKINELEKAIKDARKDGQDEYAKRLREELKKFKKERRK